MKNLILVIGLCSLLTVAGCGAAERVVESNPESGQDTTAETVVNKEAEPVAVNESEDTEKSEQQKDEILENEASQEANNQTETTQVSKVENELINLGETGTLSDWEITVKSFKFQDKVSDEYFSSQPEAGTKFAVVDMLLTNNGTNANRIVGLGNSGTLIYNEKYEYTNTRTTISGDFNFESVDPLQDKKGFIVFQVPQKVVDDAAGKFRLILEQEDGTTAEFALN